MELKYPRAFRHNVTDFVRIGRVVGMGEMDGSIVHRIDPVAANLSSLAEWGIFLHDFAGQIADAIVAGGSVVDSTTGNTLTRDDILRSLGKVFNIEHERADMGAEFATSLTIDRSKNPRG